MAPAGHAGGADHRSACHLHGQLAGLSPRAVEVERGAGWAGDGAGRRTILEVRGLGYPVACHFAEATTVI